MSGQEKRVAVIDIGSNSVRLVVYDCLDRTPVPIFNEKVLCGLGRNIDATGRLDATGSARALKTLKRFKALTEGLDAGFVEVVATAALREAEDGPDFVTAAAAGAGIEIRVLSGEEEARCAASGVLSGFHGARGLVGDLGGGSLELAEVGDGKVGRTATLALGSLRLANGATDVGRIEEELAKAPWLGAGKVDALYMVGGAWRILGRVHMATNGYPLKVLHHYEMTAKRAAKLAKTVAGLDRAGLEDLPGVRRKRIGELPFAAAVLARLLEVAGPKRVIISSYGLREGLLFERLDADDRSLDPLLTSCRLAAEDMGRFPEHGAELLAWTEPLFATETDERTRLAACSLSDIGWHWQNDYRAEESLQWVLRAPYVGLSHGERVWIALALFHRYGGRGTSPTAADVATLLDEEELNSARVMGLALRLAHRMTSGVPGRLAHARLTLGENELVLDLGPEVAALEGEIVEKRLAALGRMLSRSVSLRRN